MAIYYINILDKTGFPADDPEIGTCFFDNDPSGGYRHTVSDKHLPEREVYVRFCEKSKPLSVRRFF